MISALCQYARKNAQTTWSESIIKENMSSRKTPQKKSKGHNNIPKLLRDLPQILDTATEAAGVLYAGKLAEKIVAQDPSWAPKAESTLRSEGWGKTKLWVNTGDLRTEIHQQQQSGSKKTKRSGDTYTVQVGVFSEDRQKAAYYLEHGHDKRKKEGAIIDASLEMEHGSSEVPARPLFGPTYDREKDRMVAVQVKTINKALGKYLK